MQPINKQDVLIRLLKDGHISNEEFKALWEDLPKIPTEAITRHAPKEDVIKALSK